MISPGDCVPGEGGRVEPAGRGDRPARTCWRRGCQLREGKGLAVGVADSQTIGAYRANGPEVGMAWCQSLRRVERVGKTRRVQAVNDKRTHAQIVQEKGVMISGRHRVPGEEIGRA